MCEVRAFIQARAQTCPELDWGPRATQDFFIMSRAPARSYSRCKSSVASPNPLQPPLGAKVVVYFFVHLSRNVFSALPQAFGEFTEHLLPDEVTERAPGDVVQVESFLQGLGRAEEREHVHLGLYPLCDRLEPGQLSLS